MKMDPLAGINFDELNLKPVTQKPLRQTVEPVRQPVRQPEQVRQTVEQARQPEPLRQPEPVRQTVEPVRPQVPVRQTVEPVRQPESTYRPAPVTERPPLAQPATNPPAPKRQAGRHRLYADHVLTPTEKARRYRQKRKAVTAGALDGSLLPVELALMGNRDLCLAVARMLNRPSDLDLRQLGLPLVKELQRRLKSL